MYFPEKALLQKNHHSLLHEADIVLVTADRLMEQVKRIRPDAILCPNAVDLDHFSRVLVNNITLATSPIKLFEYMAAGKPIVTTNMPECRKYPGVFAAQNPQEFVDHLEHALTIVNNPMYLQQLYKTAQANPWEARINPIVDALATYKKAVDHRL